MTGRTYKFDNSEDTPVVSAKLWGKTGLRRVELVLDTGATMTQFHTPIIDGIGYSASDAKNLSSAIGPAGKMQEGCVLEIEKFQVFGIKFSNLLIATYDMDNLVEYGFDGLLGYDVIKQLHLEMNGPKGELTVYS